MKTRGTLIRRSPLTETSLIVHWCTHDHGIVKTVAKGARRPKSLFAGKLDLFYLCESISSSISQSNVLASGFGATTCKLLRPPIL